MKKRPDIESPKTFIYLSKTTRIDAYYLGKCTNEDGLRVDNWVIEEVDTKNKEEVVRENILCFNGLIDKRSKHEIGSLIDRIECASLVQFIKQF